VDEARLDQRSVECAASWRVSCSPGLIPAEDVCGRVVDVRWRHTAVAKSTSARHPDALGARIRAFFGLDQ
jgi:hypothetical protein